MKIFKNKIKSILTFAVTGILVSSCVNNEDNFYDFPSADKPLLSIPSTSFTAMEGETIEIPFTLSKATTESVQLSLIPVGGSAIKDDDFTAGDGAIPGENGNPESGYIFRLSGDSPTLSIPFTAVKDILAEGSETVSLSIKSIGTRSVVIPSEEIIVNISIENFESDELGAKLEWNREVTYNFINADGDIESLTEELCDQSDFDLLATGVPGNYLLGTADCPEVSSELGVLADNTYSIFVDLYQLALSETPVGEFNIPYSLTIAKVGKFSATLTYQDEYTSSSADSFPAGANAGLTQAGTLVVSGGNYTLFDKDGNQVAAE